jgi:hypothetical protein
MLKYTLSIWLVNCVLEIITSNCSQTWHRFHVKSSEIYVVVNNGIFPKITAEQNSLLQSYAVCDIRATSAYLDATVTVNYKDALETDFFRSVLFKLFSCIPLSQYRTCTHTAVTLQNMYTYRCHNTEHVHVLLSRYKTYAYYLVLQILMPALGYCLLGCFDGWAVWRKPANQWNNKAVETSHFTAFLI